MGAAQAQWFRVGPVEFSQALELSAIYTDNADETTDEEYAESGAEKEDYYIIYGFNFSVATTLYPDIDLTFTSSLNREKHFVRDDQDDDGDIPLIGDANFAITRSTGRYTFDFGLRHNADSELDEQPVFVSQERRNIRNIVHTTTADVGVQWDYERAGMSAGYVFTRTRNNDELSDGDTDDHDYEFNATWDFTDRLNARYTHTWQTTELVNNPNDPLSGKTDEDQFIGLDITILTRPSLKYSVGFAREQTPAEGDFGWQPSHTVTFSEVRDLTPSLSLNVNANYNFEREQREDEVEFTYGGTLTHRINSQYSQTFSAERQPVDTFGSTKNTDQTTYTYNLTNPDFILRGLAMTYNISWEINTPKGAGAGDEEKSTTYTFSLNRAFTVTSRVDSNLGYVWSLEDGELGDIEENRVTLRFTMQL